MEDDTLDSGLFAIALSDDESDTQPQQQQQPTNGTSRSSEQPRARNAQSEEEFQAVRAGYTVKIENGEIWKTIALPLTQPVTKQQGQALLHAVEELYFLKRYQEGADFAGRVLDGEGEGEGDLRLLDEDTRTTLVHYRTKSLQRAGVVNS